MNARDWYTDAHPCRQCGNRNFRATGLQYLTDPPRDLWQCEKCSTPHSFRRRAYTGHSRLTVIG